MLKVPGISNLTFQNANRFGVQLFKGVNESGVPVLVSTKYGTLYKVIENEKEANGSIVRAFNHWTIVQTEAEKFVYKENETFTEICNVLYRFLINGEDHPVGEWCRFNKSADNKLVVSVKKYNSIAEPTGHLSVTRTNISKPDGSYTLTTEAIAHRYAIPSGSLKTGRYKYTKTISPDGKIISNKKGDANGNVEHLRDVFYWSDGRFAATQVPCKSNIASENKRVNQLLSDNRYI